MSKTPLSDIYSGAQNFLQLQGRYLQLKYARTLTDVFSKTIRTGVMAVLISVSVLFFSVAVALWFGKLLNSLPAGFACVGVFYFVCTIVWMGTSGRKAKNIKDMVVRQLDLDLTTYDDLVREQGALRTRVAEEKEILISRLNELKQAISDIEQKFGGTPEKPGEVSGAKSEMGHRVLSTAMNVLLDVFVLPKVGLVKRAVLPFVANAVIRSKFFKSGKLGNLLSRFRKRD